MKQSVIYAGTPSSFEPTLRHLLELIKECTDLETGFLPSLTPLMDLPEPYAPITAACRELAYHYHGPEKDCRPWLNSLFAKTRSEWVFGINKLDPHTLESLMTKVSLLSHAYRWQAIPTPPANYSLKSIALPPALDEIWSALARKLGTPRVGIFYTMVANNWRIEGKTGGEKYDPNEISDSRIQLIHSWLEPPEAEELRTFVVTALEMEAKGRSVLRQIERVFHAILHNNSQATMHALMVLEGALLNLSFTFNNQIKTNRIQPTHFLKFIQPTMLWLLDHGTGPLEGASGPQACTIQLIDSFLGVPRNSPMGNMLIKSREYMLPRHKKLLDAFDTAGPILRHFSEQSKNSRLTETYNRLLGIMLSWRKSHQKRGAVYIRGENHEARPNYVSTGMVVKLGEEQATTFERAMNEHIQETTEQLQKDEWFGRTQSFDYLFRYLDETQKNSLTKKIVRKFYRQGDTIIKTNDPFPGLYMIETGSATIQRENRNLAKLGSGEIFGEMSLIENAPASADVVAEGDVKCLHLSIETLYEIISEDPRVESSVYLALAQILSQRLRLLQK